VKTSVLIVEDDPAARLAVARILKRQGYAVSEAATVAEAFARLGKNAPPPPQWILLDLMLPDGSGISVIRKVCAEQIPSRVCVVTGCAADVIADARAAGAEHALTKPLDVKRLMSILGEPVESYQPTVVRRVAE
jgi:DNA-binding response OmpR family regulator